MAANNEMVCQSCQKEPATHHICFAGTGETRDLCSECYDQDASLPNVVDNLSSLIQTGKCTYCGSPAKSGYSSGGMMPGLEEMGLQTFELWCEQCSENLKEFYEKPEIREAMNSDFPVDDEALRQAAERITQVEEAKREFMREKLAQRR
jgi:hypothetical protein